MCLGLLRGLQWWVEWQSGDDACAGLADGFAGWDFYVLAGRHDQPEEGLHVERNVDAAIERNEPSHGRGFDQD